MTEEVRPALTPEAWAQLTKDLRAVEWRRNHIMSSEPELPEEWHELAALALYGHPSGFTRADITTLREAFANQVQLSLYAPELKKDAEDLAVRLENLATRIGSLLPPRGT